MPALRPDRRVATNTRAGGTGIIAKNAVGGGITATSVDRDVIATATGIGIVIAAETAIAMPIATGTPPGTAPMNVRVPITRASSKGAMQLRVTASGRLKRHQVRRCPKARGSSSRVLKAIPSGGAGAGAAVAAVAAARSARVVRTSRTHCPRPASRVKRRATATPARRGNSPRR